jgi:hypothetical protein
MVTGVASPAAGARGRFPRYGWLGIGLVGLFWSLDWGLPGLRTHWVFFPLWLGYCLVVDAAARWQTGTSLLTRSWRRYVGLFVLSAPVWWVFELLNTRTHNWVYVGAQEFSLPSFAFWTTLDFTIVVPAVFGSAELMASLPFVRRLRAGPVIRPDRATTLVFFAVGCIGLGLLWTWPAIFFPFVWISLYFIIEPANVWLGNPTLAEWTQRGDWRPVAALWLGVLLTAFFWEMWNFFSFPKWIYHVPWGNWFHIFEMPLLGYGGYLPFSLELFAVYNLISGFLQKKAPDYIRLVPD